MNDLHDHRVLEAKTAVDHDERAPVSGSAVRPRGRKALLVLGLVLVSALGLLGLGVHLGTHGPGAWYTEAAIWLMR